MNAKSSNAEGGWGATAERTSRTDDQRIEAVTPLPPPEHLIRFFPNAGTPVERLIGQTCDKVRRIMQRKDDRLLVIMGPCSIHEPAAALEYARKLLEQRHRHADTLEIVMRVYFEKPRTTVGWKGAFTVRIRPSRNTRPGHGQGLQSGRDRPFTCADWSAATDPLRSYRPRDSTADSCRSFNTAPAVVPSRSAPDPKKRGQVHPHQPLRQLGPGFDERARGDERAAAEPLTLHPLVAIAHGRSLMPSPANGLLGP